MGIAMDSLEDVRQVVAGVDTALAASDPKSDLALAARSARDMLAEWLQEEEDWEESCQ